MSAQGLFTHGGRGSLDRRVADLFAGLSVREKAGQMVTATLAELDTGAGLADGPPGFVVVPPLSRDECRARLGDLARTVAGHRRLPVVPIGMAATPGSVRFPGPIAMAATWDRDTVHRAASSIADAAAATGVRALLGPSAAPAGTDLESDVGPCFGGDVLLASEMVAAHVRGSQGTDHGTLPPNRVGCVLTQFGAGPGQLDGSPGHWDERTLRGEVLAVAAAAVRVGVLAVMPSTASNGGIPAHVDSWLLKDVLRGEWHFDGVVLSALGGVRDLAARHRVTAEFTEAIALAVEAGVDVGADLGEPWLTRRDRLEELIGHGAIPGWLVDDALAAVLRMKIRLGLFEPQPASTVRPPAGLPATPPADRLAARAVADSVVLLSDPRDLLPLASRPGVRIGVVVAGEDTPRDPDAAGLTENLATALRTRLPDATITRRGRGDAMSPGELSIVVVPENARAAVTDVARLAAGTGGCVVVHCGTRLGGLPELTGTTASVLVGWSPVAATAGALADVLAGRLEPGGRLPLAVGAHPDGAPGRATFPLGHGRGYTTFGYSHLRIAPDRPLEGESVVVECRVENTGNRPGREIVQVYLRDRVSSVIRPERMLAGFASVTTEPGRVRTVRISLPPDRFSIWDRGMRRTIEPGTFDVLVGASAGDIRLQGRIELGAPRNA
ncbi:MAG: fibronectin type III-like domain-contianing protein [Pseudonocardia sp.]|nr:fibronectin type III-like domain-contianing protein [Pseudonocardia sp.]